MFEEYINKPLQFKILLGVFLFAIVTRFAAPPFFSHFPNFSALDATALFCGAYFARRLGACAMVLLSVWLGDIFLNKIFTGHWVLFYSGCYWQYGCYVLITLLGSTLKNKVKPLPLFFAGVASSLLFFGLSNLGVWCSGFLYPRTLDGLVACYVAAIPFFKNTMMSDLFFTMALFGTFGRIQMQFPLLKKKATLF